MRNSKKGKEFFDKFSRWLQGDELLTEIEEPQSERSAKEDPERMTWIVDKLLEEHPIKRLEKAQLKSFKAVYAVCAVICCVSLVAVMLGTIADLPRFGTQTGNMQELEYEYLTEGLEETGAVNIVAAVILNYRAFDTLGESFVLFTALCCVTILLRTDSKNEKEHLIYYDLTGDNILRRAVSLIAPMIILYGFYVMFNGHLSPGGGFSGGAIAGAGIILLSTSVGFEVMDRFFTERLFNAVSGCALGFYALSKTYSFFCEANGISSHIPKGIPGTVFSGGLILPLNIAVGLVVAMTMFGMYCLFKRGQIGGTPKACHDNRYSDSEE